MGAAAAEGEKRTLVFTYGTLKRGFSNHGLLQDLARAGDAAFVAAAATAEPLPLVCGPYRVPFLLNLPGEHGCQRVKGELYSVTARGLARLDELEGVSRAHYERLPVSVVVVVDGEREAAATEGAVAYYAHRGYAAEMWARAAAGPRRVLAGGGGRGADLLAPSSASPVEPPTLPVAQPEHPPLSSPSSNLNVDQQLQITRTNCSNKRPSTREST
ncbi:hypothetical protein ZWY2020_054958 [Hordeum vulgare]|nr:hypothetical protein ZWY2020_054958 [Hordeum vulgare]